MWTQLLKRAYRRHPLMSFAATAGAVDVLLGGLHGRVSLLIFGLGMVSAAIAFQWRRIQRPQLSDVSPSPKHYLPDHTSRPQLPMLGLSRKDPPPRHR
ncbi:MAG: hypothetical protein QNJ46_33470 [Leptolyngbyaceae cyanobacterium MO_188.B28]|nr:hypothetical protein [Leptolyngbyaceae cyanobacterium MO_188.B28]